jgi:hypothetical protein
MSDLTQGWNSTQVAQLNQQIQQTFDDLAAKIEIVSKIYDAVDACWIGPDGYKYNQEIETKANELIDEAKTAYDNIETTLQTASDSWDTFQNSY